MDLVARCQKCRSFIQIDNSLLNLNVKETLSSLGLTIEEIEQIEAQIGTDSQRNDNTNLNEQSVRSMDEVVLTANAPPPERPKSSLSALSPNHLKPPSPSSALHSASTQSSPSIIMPNLALLFHAVSGKSYFDHPLCHDCATAIMESLNRVLDHLFQEKKNSSFLTLQHRLAILKTDEEVLEGEIKKVELEHKRIQAENLAKEAELQELLQNEAELERERLALEEEEETFWREKIKSDRENAEINDTIVHLENTYNHYAGLLKVLKRTNVYNDIFHISYDGEFGTINGLRLGQSTTQSVDWNEFNAALGYSILLLNVLGKKSNFIFERFKLIPMASVSRIEKLSDDDGFAIYDMFVNIENGGATLTKLFWYRKFNSGLCAMLDCLNQLGNYLEGSSVLGNNNNNNLQASPAVTPTRLSITKHRFKLPYVIHKDRIGGDQSIKYQYGSEESWSRALKYFLTDLKWCLAYVTSSQLNATTR